MGSSSAGTFFSIGFSVAAFFFFSSFSGFGGSEGGFGTTFSSWEDSLGLFDGATT